MKKIKIIKPTQEKQIQLPYFHNIKKVFPSLHLKIRQTHQLDITKIMNKSKQNTNKWNRTTSL